MPRRQRANPALMPGSRVVGSWLVTGTSSSPEGRIPAFFEANLKDEETGATLGYITVRVDGQGCFNPHTGQIASEVFNVKAVKGWGPLLYDYAALIATNVFGTPLVSDRYTVSEQAKRVWDFYEEERFDVPKADVTSGSWDCEPVSMRAPRWGVRMPSPVFSDYWGVDARAWIRARRRDRGLPADEASPWYSVLSKSLGNPVGLTRAEISRLSSYAGESQASRPQSRLFEAQEEADTYMSLSPHFHPRGESRPETCRQWDFLTYQQAGVAYLLEQAQAVYNERGEISPRNPVRVGIFDPMGLGKTAQGVGAILGLSSAAALDGFPSPFPTLIVCPKAVIPEWESNLACFVQGVEIVRGYTNAGILRSWRPVRSDPEASPHPLVMITHYEEILSLSSSQPPELGLLIVDEAHKIKNPDTQTARAILNLANQSSYTMLLTGTPALKTAFDVLPLLRMMEGRPYVGSPTSTAQAVAEADYQNWPRTVRRADGSRLPPTAVEKFKSGWDVVDPEDARLLEEDVRRRAVRRSRRAVRESGTVDPSLLQPNKIRRAEMLNAASARAPNQRAAWSNYEAEADLAIRGLDMRSRGWQLDARTDSRPQGTDRCIAPVSPQPPLGTGIRSMQGLENNLAAVAEALRVAASSPTAASAEDVLASARQTDPAAFQAVFAAARSAYVPLPMSGCGDQVGTFIDDEGNTRQFRDLVRLDLPIRMTELMESFVGDFQASHPTADIVFYTHRLTQGGSDRVVKDLIRELARNGTRDVYVLTGTQSVNGIYRGMAQAEANRVQSGLTAAELRQAFCWPKDPNKGCPVPARPRTALISKKAEVGVSLPSADYLVMLGRSYSPALEDQIEDRVNRAGRGQNRQPEIVYFVPEDVFGYALAHRLENRRQALYGVVGEVPGDDLATPLRLPVGNLISSLTAQGQPLQGTLDAHRLRVLENYRFMESPEAFLLEMAREAYNQPGPRLSRQLYGAQRLPLNQVLAILQASEMYKWDHRELRRAGIRGVPAGQAAVSVDTWLTPNTRHQRQGLLLPDGTWAVARPGGPPDAQRVLGVMANLPHAGRVQNIDELTNAQYATLRRFLGQVLGAPGTTAPQTGTLGRPHPNPKRRKRRQRKRRKRRSGWR